MRSGRYAPGLRWLDLEIRRLTLVGAGGRFLSVCLGRFLFAQDARYRVGACVRIAGRQVTKPLRLLIHCYS